MNFIVIEKSELDANQEFSLEGERQRHLQQVIGIEIGSVLRAGIFDGDKGLATIVGISEERVILRFEGKESQSPKKLQLHVVMALPRPKVFRRTLRGLFQLGISRLTFIQTYHVEKSYWQSPYLDESEILRQQKVAMEQCGDMSPIQVQMVRRFKPFIEDVLAPLRDSKYIFHPGFPAFKPTVPEDGPRTIALGPERGFTSYEVEKFQEAGFQGAGLGPRIMTVETAAIAAAAQVTAARPHD